MQTLEPEKNRVSGFIPIPELEPENPKKSGSKPEPEPGNPKKSGLKPELEPGNPKKSGIYF